MGKSKCGEFSEKASDCLLLKLVLELLDKAVTSYELLLIKYIIRNVYVRMRQTRRLYKHPEMTSSQRLSDKTKPVNRVSIWWPPHNIYSMSQTENASLHSY